MNDKFTVEQLHWAKEDLVAGAAVSWVKELASRSEEDSTTVQEKPGGSVEAAKDIPGQYLPRHVNSIFLPGHNGEEGQEVQHQDAVAVQDDQEQAQVEGDDHQQCGGRDDTPSSARGDQQGQEAGGGGHELQQEEGGDHGGDVARAGNDGVPQAQATAFMSLRHPEKGVSPGFVKSRRRRKPDGLVQRQINSKIFFFKEQIVPSVGLTSGSSGGPCVAVESERGLKRGLDQMEGPVARKRLRED